MVSMAVAVVVFRRKPTDSAPIVQVKPQALPSSPVPAPGGEIGKRGTEMEEKPGRESTGMERR